MIPAVPTSRLLLLLTTVITVLALMGSWVPQVGAVPVVTPSPDSTDTGGVQARRRLCSAELTDFIQLLCHGKTLSYRDIYPNSFEKRRKRQSFNIVDQCCKEPCTIAEILQICSS